MPINPDEVQWDETPQINATQVQWDQPASEAEKASISPSENQGALKGIWEGYKAGASMGLESAAVPVSGMAGLSKFITESLKTGSIDKGLQAAGQTIEQIQQAASNLIPAESGKQEIGKVIQAGIARPSLQAAGATVGGILGAGSGLLTGPGAIAASPAGAVAGGTLGYGIADEVADMLENWAGTRKPEPIIVELKQAPEKLIEGATYEMAGQAIGPAISGVAKTVAKAPVVEYAIGAGKEMLGKVPAMTESGVKKLAGKFLYANTSKGPLIAKNIETAKAIEDQIPGLKFTYGEMTGDPGIVKLERATMREPGQFAQDFIERQRANDAAIQASIEAKRPQGKIGDVIEAFGGKQAAAEQEVKMAEQQLSAETEKLGMGSGTLEAGQTIRTEAEAAKKAAKKEGKKLYQSIPEYDWQTIDASKLAEEADALTQPMNRLENIEENVPWKQIDKLKEVLAEDKNIVSLKDLDGFQSEIKAEIRKLKSGPEVNERKLSRLTQLNNNIENLIEDAAKSESAQAQKLGEARQYWKNEVIQKFKSGNVGDILQPGRQGYRIEDAQVASKFFKPGASGKQAAMQFNAAIGGNAKAKAAIEDAVKQNLLSKFSGDEITETGLRRWLNQNKQALDELGLTDKFNDLKKAREQLTDAIQFQKEFQKSEAAKILGSDPDLAIKKALGEVNVGKAAANLMRATKGNKQAQAGLRNALEDYILSQSGNLETGMISKIDTLDKLTKKYRPAFNILYSSDKAALKAWDTARQAFRIAQKERKSPIATGSDTAENLLTSFFKAAGVHSGRIGTLVRAFLKPLKETEATKVKALVNRALLDPDFAYTLMLGADAAQPGIIKGTLPKYHLAGRKQLIKNGVLPEYLKRRISQHLATITGTTMRPLKSEEQPAP